VSRYCVGDIVVDDQALEFHCWIEIGHQSSSRRWVVDLTGDQYEILADRAFVYDRHDKLVDLSIEYNAFTRLSVHDLRHDPVWRRTEVLARRMSRWFRRGRPTSPCAGR
jgi:hypothetical protein